MAIEVWKDVLHPGRQCDRHGRWFAFTAKDTAQAHRNVQAMLSRGWHVPACWEHQDAAEPASLSAADAKAAFARHTFGHVVGSRLDANGVLWLKHRLHDPRDAEQLRKTRFVSPKVYPSGYTDSAGHRYPGKVVTHVAATPVPVQSWQQPFELGRADALYLSYTPEGGTVADDADKGKTDDKPAAPPPKEEPPAPKGDGNLTALIDALRETGHTIPDEVTDIPGLIIAVKAGGPPDRGGDDGLGLDDPGATTGAGAAPVLMSAADAADLIDQGREALAGRARKLFHSGRVDRPTAARLVREAQAVDLSFTTAGKRQPCPLADRIAALETLPKGMVWSPAGRPEAVELSATAEIDPPKELTGKSGRDEAAEEAERLAAKYSVK